MVQGKRISDSQQDLESQDRDVRDSARSSRASSAKSKRGLFTRTRIFLFLLLLLVGSVIFAPQIISHTPVGDWLIGQAIPSHWGTLKVAEKNLSWWSPVSVGQVQLHAPDGGLLADVGSIQTKETLWQIVSSGQVTQVDVDAAAARIDWRQDGSNWEDLIFQVLPKKDTDNTPSNSPDMTINLTNSQVLLESRSDQQRWLANPVNAKVLVLSGGSDVQIETSAAILDANQNLPAGQIKARLAVGDPASLTAAMQQLNIAGSDSPAFASGTANGGLAFAAQLDQMAVSVGRSIARRFLPNFEASGLASGNINGVANFYGDFVQIQTPQVSVERLALADRDYLAGDVLRQQNLNVRGGFEMNPTGLALSQLNVQGDFGKADLDGVLNYEELMNIVTTRHLPQTGISSSGEVNLAQLANQLPNTLSLRKDLVLEQGDLNWQIFNRRDGDGAMRLFVDLTAKNIAGRSSSQRVVWAKPVRISTSMREYDRPAMIDDVTIESDFLAANAKPQSDGGAKVDFSFDFDRLKQAIEQVFELPPMTMQGSGSGQAQWKVIQTGGVIPDINSQFSLALKNANLEFPGYFELRDPNVKLDANAYLQFGDADSGEAGWMSIFSSTSDVIIKQAGLTLQTGRGQTNVGPSDAGQANTGQANTGQGGSLTGNAGDDPEALLFRLNVTQAVSLQRLNQVFRVLAGSTDAAAGNDNANAQTPVMLADIQVLGPLDRWTEIVRPLLSGTDLAMTGSCQTSGTLSLMDQYALLSNLNGKSQNFGFRGFGVILQEPTLQAAGAVSYHYANGLIHSGDMTVTGTTLAARAVKTKLLFTPSNTKMEGEIYFRGDLARIWHTVNLIQMAAAEDAAIKLGGHSPLPLQTLPKFAAAPEFNAIALVNFLEPAPSNHPNAAALPGAAIPNAAAGKLSATAVSSSTENLRVGGEWVGMMRFEQNETNATVITLESLINNAWVGGVQPNGQLAAWVKEPQIKLNGNGSMSADLSTVNVPQLIVQSQQVNAALAAAFAQLNTQPTMQVRGNVNAPILDWVRPLAGEALGDLAINGLNQHTIEVVGPIDVNQLTGRWSTQWQDIRWMGLAGGPSNIVLDLSGGIVRMQPLKFNAGGGLVTLAPEVDLRGEPIWVRMPRGPVFEQVNLTPQLCRNWLKYAAPLLAEVTSVQGTFSLDSDGIEVPISDWTNMVAKAKITINGARVGPGPLGVQIGQLISTVKTVAEGGSLDAAALNAIGLGGASGLVASGNGQRTAALENLASGVLGSLGNGQKPSLQDLAQGIQAGGTNAGETNLVAGSLPNSLLESSKTWLDIPQQTIGLHFQDNGLVHDNLKMSIKGFELVTNGKVGLDQSLAVNAVLNIPQEVLNKNPDIANALGPNLQMPITGTLTKPSIQSTQLRTALNTAVNRGVQKALGDQLEKKLGVPGLGALGTGSGGEALNGLMQQGQQKINDTLQEKLGVPNLGSLGSGNAADPLGGLIQQGQQRASEKLNQKFGLPEGSNPLQGLFPGMTPNAAPLPNTTPPANGTPANNLPLNGTQGNGTQGNGANPGALPPGNPPAPADPVNQLLNKQLDKGFKKLFGGN